MMNALTRDGLWQRLRDAQLVSGDAPPAAAASSPWYVRVMLGTAGWIGALFLLGFVGIGFAWVIENAAAAIAVGMMCCAAAYALFRAAPSNDFAAQFALAVSLAGQALFVIGVTSTFRSSGPEDLLVIAAFEAALAALLPNFVHRVWCALAAAVALSWALSRLGVPQLVGGAVCGAFAIVWLNEFAWSRYSSIWRPVGYGLALSLLQVDATLVWGHMGALWHAGASWGYPVAPWIGKALIAGIFLYTVWRLLQRERASASSQAGMAAIAASLIVAAMTFAAPGVTAALLILVLGFANGNRVLAGLGLLALGAYLIHYYYQLDVTLLTKSLVLLGTGLALLAVRHAVHKWLAEQEAAHA